jgi:hypothetical protein
LELDGRKIEEEEKERRREFVQTTGGGAAAAAVAALKLLIEGSHTHTTAGMNVHFFFLLSLSSGPAAVEQTRQEHFMVAVEVVVGPAI